MTSTWAQGAPIRWLEREGSGAYDWSEAGRALNQCVGATTCGGLGHSGRVQQMA